MELMYLALTRMPGVSYRRRLISLLYLCYVFRALINSLVCRFYMSALGLVVSDLCSNSITFQQAVIMFVIPFFVFKAAELYTTASPHIIAEPDQLANIDSNGQ